MINKIVLINQEPPIRRYIEIYHLGFLISEGFEVEYWDCTEIFIGTHYQIADIQDISYCYKYNSIGQLQTSIQSNDNTNTVYLIQVSENYSNRKFFKLIADSKITTVKIDFFAAAALSYYNNWQKIFHTPLVQFPGIIYRRIKARMFDNYCKKQNFKYTYTIGSSLRSAIRINHPDWQHSQEIKNEAAIINYPYIVFLDEYYPLHPDLVMGKAKINIGGAPHYQQIMTRFFDIIEQQNSVKVVIASHPKAQYSGTEFGEREIIKYKTAELVKDAQAVVLHTSAAVAYAFIYDKPLVIIYTNEYAKLFHSIQAQKTLSLLTKVPRINIANYETTQLELKSIDAENRQQYINDYLTSPGIEDKTNQEILLNFFRSI